MWWLFKDGIWAIVQTLVWVLSNLSAISEPTHMFSQIFWNMQTISKLYVFIEYYIFVFHKFFCFVCCDKSQGRCMLKVDIKMALRRLCIIIWSHILSEHAQILIYFEMRNINLIAIQKLFTTAYCLALVMVRRGRWLIFNSCLYVQSSLGDPSIYCYFYNIAHYLYLCLLLLLIDWCN
jgi:hypothetical protein